VSERTERLRRMALPGGGVIGLAIDHRDALRQAASRGGWTARDAELTDLKRRLLDGLAAEASMVLIDEELGGPLLDAGLLPDDVGLAMPLEAQGYESVGNGRVTRLLDDFGPSEAAARGADGCKLLLPFRPDHEASAVAQEAVASRALAACHAEGLPLILEPLVHIAAGEQHGAYEAAYAGLVIETARRLARIGPDLLKVQFPGLGSSSGQERCRELHAACSPVPWVLLGGGQEVEQLERQVEEACRAGAAGVIVGRTVWDVALVADAVESAERIRQASLPILRRLRRAVEAYARPLAA
jgi:tagatose 1,6-diphosphate aldolase